MIEEELRKYVGGKYSSRELKIAINFYRRGLTDKKPTVDEMLRALRMEYEKGRADAIAEMENEWRDEDEDLLVSIEDSLSDYLDYTIKDNKLTKHGKDIAELRVLGYIDWLKSLKNRMGGSYESKDNNRAV